MKYEIFVRSNTEDVVIVKDYKNGNICEFFEPNRNGHNTTWQTIDNLKANGQLTWISSLVTLNKNTFSIEWFNKEIYK